MAPFVAKRSRLVDVILSSKEPFSSGDLIQEAKNLGITIKDQHDVDTFLTRLCDNGIIREHGSKFSVLI